MKYFFYYALLIFTACKSTPETQKQQSVAMGSRKAAIAERLLFNIYTLHFDLNTPQGHPVKIEEYIIQGWQGERNDTINREYFYEKDKLVKVFDNEFGGSSTYVIKYDDKGRRMLVDQQTPNGSFHKDTFEYHPHEPFQAVRQHFKFNKPEDKLQFNYHGDSDSIEVVTYDGTDMYLFRESKDTLFVEMIWRDHKGRVLSNKIEAYDSTNRLVKVTSLEQGLADRSINYVYDDYGNQIARIELDVDNVIGGSAGISAVSAPRSYHTVYEYDYKGNWIKKTEKSNDKKYKAVTKRKITYVQ